jgi:hypothetical protein
VKKLVAFTSLVVLAGSLGFIAAACGSEKNSRAGTPLETSSTSRTQQVQTLESSPPKLDGDGRYFGLIEAARAEPPTISFDVAQFFFGDAVQKAAEEDGAVAPGEPVANDHYERNPSKQTESLKLAKDVQITAAGPVTRLILPAETRARCRPQCTEEISVTLADFVASFRKRKDALSAAGGPFWVMIKDGLVVRIDEQYFP